jgi:methyl-accepting chemotaxis protein
MTTNFAQALQTYKQGQYEAAMQQFEELAAANPQDANVTLWLGQACREAGYPERARQWFQAVMELTDNKVLLQQARMNLAKLGETVPVAAPDAIAPPPPTPEPIAPAPDLPSQPPVEAIASAEQSSLPTTSDRLEFSQDDMPTQLLSRPAAPRKPVTESSEGDTAIQKAREAISDTGTDLPPALEQPVKPADVPLQPEAPHQVAADPWESSRPISSPPVAAISTLTPSIAEPDVVSSLRIEPLTRIAPTPETVSSASTPMPSGKGETLRRRLLITILPVVLAPLAIASFIGLQVTRQTAETRLTRDLYLRTQMVGATSRRILEEALRVPGLVATSPDVIESVRAGGQQAEKDKLPQVPVEQLEQRFGSTKLLQPNDNLNQYLVRVGVLAGFEEIFVTEKHGYNIAYSNLTSDFVQQGEGWWEQSKQRGSVVNTDYDASANTFGLELMQSIQDPDSGTFLGVVKAVLAAQEYGVRLHEILKNLNLRGSQSLQLLDIGSQKVLSTVTADGLVEQTVVLGDQDIPKIATLLLQTFAASSKFDQVATLAALQNLNLPKKHNLANYSQEVFTQETGELAFIVTFRKGSQDYFLSNVPLTNFVAISSIDTAELQGAGRELLTIFAWTALLLGGVATILILELARRLSQPMREVSLAAQQVATGDLDVRAKVQGTIETQTLAQGFNNLVTRVKSLLTIQQLETQRIQTLKDITVHLSRSLQVEDIFKTAVDDMRQALNADRVIVYRFDVDWKGTITEESVAPGFPAALGAEIADPCFADKYVEQYVQGRVQATPDIAKAGLTDCHLKQLRPFAIKANLVAPILVRGDLLGLLIAHQCSAPRDWQASEIDLFTQVATQVGLALERATLLEQAEAERQQAETATHQAEEARLQAEISRQEAELARQQSEQAAQQSASLAEEQRQQKTAIQMQLIDLLSSVDGASRGDLTVRADVTAGDIGTVADFFNSIIQSLRQIVVQVKQSAEQVNASIGTNESQIRELSEAALRQATEINRTLDSVANMSDSIQAVAKSAQQAARVARKASTTAETGGAAMDRTVDSILKMRDTVAETAQKVKQLGESSQQISRIVALINQIALQTDLLAINAGIEAARAGAAGQRFAVVAQEVGNLAAQSANATKEIEQIVESIQRETNEVADAITQGTTQVLEGTKLVEETKQSLGEIVEVSRQIDQLVQFISTATVSQAETSTTVTNLMKEIASVSERTSMSSLQVSDALQQTVAVAQQLQASVGTFKVEEGG